MRIFRTKRKDESLTDAQRAVEQSRVNLADAKARTLRVDETSQALQRLRRENHFAERLGFLLRETKA